jgi:hypothetical protein
MLQKLNIVDGLVFISRVGKSITKATYKKKKSKKMPTSKVGTPTSRYTVSTLSVSKEEPASIFPESIKNLSARSKRKYLLKMLQESNQQAKATSSFLNSDREYHIQKIQGRPHIGPCHYSPRYTSLQTKYPTTKIQNERHQRKRSLTNITICKELMYPFT